MRPNDSFGRLMNVLGELNLRPDFNLSIDQETKLAAVRETFKQSQDAWRKQHESALKELEEQAAALREQGPDGDPDERRQHMEARRELMSSSPNGDAEVKQATALLTPEQSAQLEKRLDELPPPPQGGPGGGPGGEGRGQGRPQQGGRGERPQRGQR
jgi:hypothetical protein